MTSPAPIPAPVVVNEPGSDDEHRLRDRLAKESDPSEPALQLVDLLSEDERHREALVIVDLALRRSTDWRLRVARAGLLRDLGQRHLAVRELRALEQALPPERISPEQRFDLAQLEWLEGEATAAAATLERLLVLAADSEWLRVNRAEVAQLGIDIQRGGRPQRMGQRDMFGNLRGAPTVPSRMAMLDRLLTIEELGAEAARITHVTALRIASRDASPAVRARAVQRGQPDPADAPSFFLQALADESPLVRRCAAPRLVAVLQGDAWQPLLGRLAVETDGMAFLAIHGALASLRPAPRACSDSDAADPQQRAALVAAWQSLAGARP